MKPVLIAGTIIVNLALISYTIAFVSLSRRKIISKNALLFFSLGISLDLSATLCMIMGSSHGMITAHGLVGYSSFIAMFIETIWLWRAKGQNGFDSSVSASLKKYSYFSYFWWIAAYITGAVIVAMRHH